MSIRIILALLVVLLGVPLTAANAERCTNASREFRVPEQGTDMIPFLEHLYVNECARGYTNQGEFIGNAIAKNYHNANIIWLSNGDYYKLPEVLLPEHGPVLRVKKGDDVLAALRLYYRTDVHAQNMFKEHTFVQVFKFLYTIPPDQTKYPAPQNRTYALPPMRPRIDVPFNKTLIRVAAQYGVLFERLRSRVTATEAELQEVLSQMGELRERLATKETQLAETKAANVELVNQNAALAAAVSSTPPAVQAPIEDRNETVRSIEPEESSFVQKVRTAALWFGLVLLVLLVLSMTINALQLRKNKKLTEEKDQYKEEIEVHVAKEERHRSTISRMKEENDDMRAFLKREGYYLYKLSPTLRDKLESEHNLTVRYAILEAAPTPKNGLPNMIYVRHPYEEGKVIREDSIAKVMRSERGIEYLTNSNKGTVVSLSAPKACEAA